MGRGHGVECRWVEGLEVGGGGFNRRSGEGKGDFPFAPVGTGGYGAGVEI